MNINFWLFLPEFTIVGLALIVLGLDLFLPQERKHWLAYLGTAGILVAIGLSFTLVDDTEKLYGGLFLVDDYALFFKVFVLILGAAMMLFSVDYVKKHLRYPGEYYGIVLFSVLAMMFMTAAGELLTAYISLELLTFSLYVLASYARDSPKSAEGGMKYILIGAFSSALLLYGLSLIYGTLGTTTYEGIATVLSNGGELQKAFLAGLVLVVVGLGFKITAVPFHMWAPDVYEGAPTPVTAYLAVASKVASFALLLRLFGTAFLPALDQWQGMVAGLSAATMTLGNFVAISQKNIKRMLAYSSIGQAGVLLLGIAALSELGSNGLIFHLVGYSATNFAAFVSVIVYFNLTGKENIEDFAGLAERSPFLAFALTVSLFSLAGLPFFAGFATKFYLFTGVAKEGLIWLAALAIVNSAISLYYYLMVIKQMYLRPATDNDNGRLKIPPLQVGVLSALMLVIFWVGIYPAPILNLIEKATSFLYL